MLSASLLPWSPMLLRRGSLTRDTTAEARLGVSLVLLVSVATSRTATHFDYKEDWYKYRGGREGVSEWLIETGDEGKGAEEMKS